MTEIENLIPLSPPALTSVSQAEETELFDEELRQSGNELWLYRERTAGLLRRYFRVSIEVGRLPSLLGRELFRAKVSVYSAHTFEDAVIFVHDVEHCLEDLNDFDRRVLGKVVFQDYSQDEAAQLLGCGRKTIGRRVPEILDLISERLLDHGLLCRIPGQTPIAPETVKRVKTMFFSQVIVAKGKINFEIVSIFPLKCATLVLED